MKEETQKWLSAFLAGFLATVLGIVLTFGVQGLINSGKRTRTAKLLAKQVVEKMDRTCEELQEYLDIYDSLDSTYLCLLLAQRADTLERVDSGVVGSFLINSLAEYVQSDIGYGLDSYTSEILNTIGNVELVGHIDQFYNITRQCAKVSQQVIDQKRIVSDRVYSHFFESKEPVTEWDFVRYIFEIPEFNVFYTRLQKVRPPLKEGKGLMIEELEECKKILRME